MPNDTEIVLKCKKGLAGINAAIVVDGVPDPAYSVQDATYDDVRSLYDRAIGHFGDQVEINESCAECFPDLFPKKE